MVEQKRKTISLKVRKQVLEKYSSHCAYCGKVLDLKSLRVDHLIPVRKGGLDDIENYMPACRNCNHYKLTYDLEQFRELLQSAEERLLKPLLGRVCQDFGIITVKKFSGKFYFEERSGEKE